MIRALLFCYDFPPLNTVAAARLKSWSDYLVNHGIHPCIITRKWSGSIIDTSTYFLPDSPGVVIEERENQTIVRIPYKPTFLERLNYLFTQKNLITLRKVLTFLTTFLKYKNGTTTELQLYRLVEKHVSVTDFSIIVASGEPFILFKYAAELAAKYNIPWVADYRDGFTYNPIKNQDGLYGFVNRVERKFEARMLKSCLFFTAASQTIANQILSDYGAKPYTVVPNGVDLDLFHQIEEPRADIFTVVYTGTIYQKHNVAVFLKGFQELIDKNPKLQIQLLFIGIDYRPNDNTHLIHSFCNNYPKLARVEPHMPKEKAIRWQKRAHILLKFSSDKVIDGYYGAKLYEYAAHNKPILNVVPNKECAVTDFFEESGLQTLVYEPNQVQGFLSKQYQLFLSKKRITPFLTKEQIEGLSRRRNVATLATAIKTALNETQSK